MKKLILISLALLMAVGGYAQKQQTMHKFTVKTSWQNKNKAYKNFTDLGNYALLMKDVDVKDAEKSLARFANRDMFRTKPACTATVKVNKKGEVIFGRNMDIDVSQTPVMLTTVNGGKYQALVFTYNGPTGYTYDILDKFDADTNYQLEIPYCGTDAMNEAGLYIETNMREMDDKFNFYCSGTNPGKTRAPFLSLPALAAANCGTVEEMLEFLNNSYDWYTPGFELAGEKCIWNMAFLVGDATGNYGLIEFAWNKFQFVPYCSGHANYYIHPQHAEYAVNGAGFGRLNAAFKGLTKCQTEKEMMDNMKSCWYMKEILNPGCLGYSDNTINVNDRRNMSKSELQKAFDEKMAPSQPAARKYVQGDEKDLRDSGNVWTTSLNFGVNCMTRHLLLRLWEHDNVVIDVQWK